MYIMQDSYLLIKKGIHIICIQNAKSPNDKKKGLEWDSMTCKREMNLARPTRKHRKTRTRARV